MKFSPRLDELFTHFLQVTRLITSGAWVAAWHLFRRVVFNRCTIQSRCLLYRVMSVTRFPTHEEFIRFCSRLLDKIDGTRFVICLTC